MSNAGRDIKVTLTQARFVHSEKIRQGRRFHLCLLTCPRLAGEKLIHGCPSFDSPLKLTALKPSKPRAKEKPISSLHSKPPVSQRKLWLFRIVALLLPVLVIGLLEIVLRILGYGYDTSFLQNARVNGKDYFVNNDGFSLRFFPPALARCPGTLMIPAIKSPDTTRIFVFGESAAMGDPQPAYGASRYLEVLLRRRFPGKQFEIINVAFTAINSHVILPIARECAQRDGDIWIVYMGNNEMVGPFGAATVFGSQSPPRAMVRLNLALQQLRVGQLAMAGLRKWAGKSADTAWGGMQMFLQNQVPPADQRRETVYRNFEGNLRDILNAGLDSGAKIILNTMSVNLKDCPPFASLANSNLPAVDRETFQNLYGEGLALEKTGNNLEAARKYAQAAQIDATFAELQFRWAACLLRSTNSSAATNFQLACLTDALPFRADSRINATIRQVAREFTGKALQLSDAESTLAAASPHGIAGDESFFEHVHFNFQGNYLLGRLWAEQIKQLLPDQVTTTAATDWAPPQVCDRDLGLTPWNRSFVIESVVRRMQQPPLSSQLNNSNRLAALQAELRSLQIQQSDTNVVMRSGQVLVDAIQRAPTDRFLHEGLANLYEVLGDLKRAVAEYRKVLEMLPHDFYSKQQLGRLLGELGQPAEGEVLLLRAVNQRPSLPDVWNELGDICMMQKKYAQALNAYERAAELQPREASYVSRMALALSKMNRRSDAIAAYRRAIKIQPDYQDAHFELAGTLAADNQLEEAAREYTEAIRLDPNHTVSRINLGVVFFRQTRLGEAIQQFEAALRIDPQNAAAADYLRQATDKQNHPRQRSQ